MIPSQRVRDRLWLVWFGIQLPVILCVDAVDKYPAWLVVDADAPLHALHRFRQWYVATYHDPLFDWTPATGAALTAGGSWVALFLWIELLFSLPVAVYAAARLARLALQPRHASALAPAPARTTGALELLLLVYAFETALTTAVVIYDVGAWNPDVYSAAQKNIFRYQMFGPWLALPALLFVDMYSRLLARFGAADAAATAAKKVQ